MDRRAYSAADITVKSFEEVVRQRPGMYFGAESDSPNLPAIILQVVTGDALHAADGSHRPVDVEVTGDLCFTVTDEHPPQALTTLASPGRASTDR